MWSVLSEEQLLFTLLRSDCRQMSFKTQWKAVYHFRRYRQKWIKLESLIIFKVCCEIWLQLDHELDWIWGTYFSKWSNVRPWMTILLLLLESLKISKQWHVNNFARLIIFAYLGKIWIKFMSKLFIEFAKVYCIVLIRRCYKRQRSYSE